MQVIRQKALSTKPVCNAVLKLRKIHGDDSLFQRSSLSFASLFKLHECIGESVAISATGKNVGTETFSVSAYYDTNLIETKNVADLMAGATKDMDFTWNTTGVASGDYTIKVTAETVSGETNTNNNIQTKETFTLSSHRSAWPTTEIIIAGAAAAIIIISAGAYFIFMRRKKPTKTASPPFFLTEIFTSLLINQKSVQQQTYIRSQAHAFSIFQRETHGFFQIQGTV